MRNMKNTGITWCPSIPDNWNIDKVKNYFYISKEQAGQKEPTILKLARSGVQIRDISTNEGQLAESYENYNPIQPGDLLLNPMDLYSGANCNVSEISGVISPAYVNLRAKKELNPKYFDFYFKVQYWTMAMFAHGKGVSFDNRWTINAEGVKNYELPIPSLAEQNAIVDKIEAETIIVDALIANQEAQIEKLKAYKQSLITEVVTKGLNPNTTMKDSGAEWLKLYPSHWEYKPFGYVLHERNERNAPVVTEERLSLSIDLGVTLYSEKTTNLDRFKDDFSQYKIAHAGDLVMNSMNMIVGASGVSPYYGCVSPAYYTFFDNESDHVTAKYCEYLFKSKTMLRVLHSMGKGIYSIDRGDDKINTCRLKVPKIELKALHIPVPPIDEQRNIVEYLNRQSSLIDRVIAKKNEKIEKLNQYKKSLIYEYVTGKKEVVC